MSKHDKSTNVVWHHATVTRERREKMNKHPPVYRARVNQPSRIRWKKNYINMAAIPTCWMAIMYDTVCVPTCHFRMKTAKKISAASARCRNYTSKPASSYSPRLSPPSGPTAITCARLQVRISTKSIANAASMFAKQET